MTLSSQLPEEAERRLREVATRQQVPIAYLAAAAVRFGFQWPRTVQPDR